MLNELIFNMNDMKDSIQKQPAILHKQNIV